MKYYECALLFLPWVPGTQNASLLHSFAFSSVACLAVPYFPTVSHKRQDIQDIFTEHKISFYFLYNFSDILS